MWNDLSPVWQACVEEAWQAYCAGSVPIGAAIADAHGQVIGRGRNRIADQNAVPVSVPAEDLRANRPVFNHDLAHAEINALLSLRATPWDESTPNNKRQWTLHTTMEPCPLCLGAFYMSGLRQLHYAARDSFAGSVNLLGTTPYLSRKPIRVSGPHPELEPICLALVVESHLQETSGERTQFLLSHWREAAPQGVALGERLFSHQLLRNLQADGASAAEMVRQALREMA